MNKKIRVGLLFGGKSAEHEVSLQSAKNVAEAIDKNKYEVVLIGIDKSGRWLMPDQAQSLLNDTNPKLIALNTSNGQNVALIPQSGGELTNLTDGAIADSVDVIFPILHGTSGEDGTIQGLLKLANIPFVGAGVLGSAVGMDKDVMKRLLREAGLPIGKFLTVKENTAPTYAEATRMLGTPIFVKPANLGSSVGVSKVGNEDEYKQAMREAFRYDRKILLEEAIVGREIECAVLGNEEPRASIVGEVIASHNFYSCDAKYIDENGATVDIPANLSSDKMAEAEALAVKVFKTLECEGMGRVDMFLRENGELLVNEINTIPGFTSISMYPKLWEASGVSYTKLIDTLITLALERFEKEKQLETSL